MAGRQSATTRLSRGGLLHRVAAMAIAAPKRTLAIAALVMLATGIFGIPVAQSLSAGGFQDPTAESARATTVLTDKFGQGDLQLLFVVSAPDGVTGPAARAVGTEIAELLRHSTRVTSVMSPWTAPPAAAASLVSNDGKSGLIAAGLGGGETKAQKYADALADNDESVASGVAQTGRVVTAAALVMSISFAALIAAHVSFMRMFGVGLTLAVIVDATVLRLVLVPAFMHVLGTWCWWAPKSLARLHEQFGISEGAADRAPRKTFVLQQISEAATVPATHAFQER